jgi:hypothetical protein
MWPAFGWWVSAYASELVSLKQMLVIGNIVQLAAGVLQICPNFAPSDNWMMQSNGISI